MAALMQDALARCGGSKNHHREACQPFVWRGLPAVFLAGEEGASIGIKKIEVLNFGRLQSVVSVGPPVAGGGSITARCTRMRP